MSRDVVARARVFRERALQFADAIREGEPEAIEVELQARQQAFDEFIEIARAGLDAETRTLVEEVLELDREVQLEARGQLAAIRAEIEQLAQLRRMVEKGTSQQAARFVSRRV